MSFGSQIGRLAMRQEGAFWNAYYAMPNTMDGALLLGSIHMNTVQRAERKDAFMTLMREVVSDIIEDACGTRPVWPQPMGVAAPQHERAGHS